MARPIVTVVGLGPGDPGLVTTETLAAIAAHRHRFIRTMRHPSAGLIELPFTGTASPDAAGEPVITSFDHLYETSDTFEQTYQAITRALVGAAQEHGEILYAVPGSPLVAEHTIELLLTEPQVACRVLPAVSFVELCWNRVGVDPFTVGVRLVDGHRFEEEVGRRGGALLVGQCHSRRVLSDIKLSTDRDPEGVVVLQRLGTSEEAVFDVPWEDLDRAFEPDHLTSLWIPNYELPLADELLGFADVVATLRQQCPWDRVQTHHSLRRYLLEESYEVLEAIDGLPAALDSPPTPGVEPSSSSRVDPSSSSGVEPSATTAVEPSPATAVEPSPATAVDQLPAAQLVELPDLTPFDHLCEELGDLLFQVYFHATIASESGAFDLADVAGGVSKKLIDRHPHVFAGAAADSLEANWELRKRAEKRRDSVLDGVPTALPALARAEKMQKKAKSLGLDWPDLSGVRAKLGEELAELDEALAEGSQLPAITDELGDVLFTLVNLARTLSIDPEAALRAATAKFERRARELERAARAQGINPAELGLEALDRLWEQAKKG